MLKNIGRILSSNPIYNKLSQFLYTDTTLKEQYQTNLNLINDWLNDTDNTINRVLNFMLSKQLITENEYKELPTVIKNKWQEIKQNLLIVKLFFENNYLYNYFDTYHTNNKVLYSCTSYTNEESLDINGNSKFIASYLNAKSNDINGIYSEPFIKIRIEQAFAKHLNFRNYVITNYQSEPCGEKTCPDHGWTILDPNGEKYGNLYIEVKTCKTDVLKNGKLGKPSYSNAGKSNTSIEECFLPVIKTNGEWVLNPCFFTIIVFVNYVEQEYKDLVTYKVLQYYMSQPNMLQLSIEYKKHADNTIGIQQKSKHNNNTILKPICQKWITKEFDNIYNFIKHYQLNY